MTDFFSDTNTAMLFDMTLAAKVRGEGAREYFRYEEPLRLPLSRPLPSWCAALSLLYCAGVILPT